MEALPRPEARRTPFSNRWVYIAILIAGGAVGLASGASLHYQSSVGGLGGALAGAFTFLGLAAMVGVSALIALLAALLHRTGIALAFGAFAGGIVLGGLVGLAVGPTYRPSTEATGTVRVVLSAPAPLEWSSQATCRSVENGSTIASVSVDQVAKLDDQVVWLRLGLGDGAAASPTLELGQPLDQDRTPPYPYREYRAIGSTLTIDRIDADQHSGSIGFTDLALVEGPPFPLTPPAKHLAGRVEWSCNAPPGQGGTDPKVVGRLQGQLSMTAVGGGFGVAFPLDGSCAAADFGLSDWTGRATATNGQTVRAEIQLDGSAVSVALYLDPDAKDTPYRILFENPTSPGKGSSGFLEPMQTTEFGELKVIGEWTCRA